MTPDTRPDRLRILTVSSSDLDRDMDAIAEVVNTVNSESDRFRVAGRYEYDRADELPELSDYNLAIFLLGKRWGPRSGRYSSSFKRLFAAAQSAKVDRLLYVRVLPDDLLLEPDHDAEKIIAFCDEVEKDKKEMIAWYDRKNMLRALVTDDLRRRVAGRRPKRRTLRTLPDHQNRLAGFSNALGTVSGGPDRTAFGAARRAFAYANQGRFTKACRTFAKTIAESREPYLVNEYGLFLKANDLLHKAEQVFEHLAQMGQFMEDKLVIGSALRHLGDINQKMNRMEMADSYYRKALSMEQGQDRILKQAVLNEERGMICLKTGSSKEAAKLFKKSLDLYKQADLIEGQALCYYCLTGAYIELEDVDKAMDAAENALEMFRKLNEPAMIEKLQMLLDKLDDIRSRSGD